MPTAIRDGNWTDPSTWDVNREPLPGERVIIPSTVNVIYDITFELMLRRIIRDQLKIASSGEVTETSPFNYDVILPTVKQDGSPIEPLTLRSQFDAANAVSAMWRSVGYNVNLRFSLAQSAEDWIVDYLMSKEPIIGVTVETTLIKVLVLSRDNSVQSILSAVRQAEQEALAVAAVLTSIEGRTWNVQFFVSIEREGI